MHTGRAPLVALTSVCLVFALAAEAGAQIAPADKQAVQQLVNRLYDARVRKDVAALAALYSARAPQRVNARFPANYLFPYERLEVTNVAVAGLKEVAGTVTARAIVDVTVTPTPVDKPRAERWIRNMGFVREGEAWMLWREAPAAEDLAVEIGRATSAEEQAALLLAEPDLITEELAFALEAQGDRQFVSAPRSALPFYALELELGERLQAVTAAARGHFKIAQVLQLTDTLGLTALPERYRASAAEHFQKALDGFTKAGDRPRMAAAEVGTATSNYMKDDVASRDHYRNAIDIFETLPDRVVLANALHGYGNACFMVGDYSAAIEAYRRSMDLQVKAGTRASIAALWQAIGRVQKKQGDYEAALDSCRKSLADAGLLDPGTQFGSVLELADVYRLQGRFELALDEYGQALALAQARDDKQGAMRVEADIGNVYMAEQQPSAALAHYEKSVDLARQLRNQDGVARALAGAGLAHFAQLRHDAALDAFSSALAIRTTLADKTSIAWLQAHIGLVQSAAGRHEEALASFQRALDLSNELSDAASVAVMNALLAGEHADLGHGEQALDLAEKAAVIAGAIEGDDTVARAKVVTARVLLEKGDRGGAERALRDAVAAVESGRARAGDEPFEGFFGDRLGPYREMALFRARGGPSENGGREALAYAERAHLGLLTDILAGNRSLLTNGLSAEEQEEERRLSGAHKSLRVQVDKERTRAKPDMARLEDLKRKLADAEQQRTSFVDRTYAAHPTLKLQRGVFDPATPEQFSALADAGTVIVEFVTGEKQTLAIVLTGPPAAGKDKRADIDDFALPIRAYLVDVSLLDLTRQVREYRAAIRDRDPDIARLGQGLHRLLFPGENLLANHTRLIVVPDGPLWSLPFQALQAEDGRYLIQDCAVSYAPSLTALTLLARSSLAPPVASPRTRRAIALGNQRAGSAAARLQLLNASANLSPMPNAEAEALKLAQVYGPKRLKTYTGPAVRQDTVRADAQTAAVLHLATFFVPSAASPLRSPMVVSIDRNGQADVVEAWELMRTALPPLTVVSRVQVDRIGGDAAVPVGVSWVLFTSGTKTAVLATWPDDSAGAVSLMVGLHRALATSPTAGAARSLRQAVLPLLRTKYRHPFYWANYMVIGE